MMHLSCLSTCASFMCQIGAPVIARQPVGSGRMSEPAMDGRREQVMYDASGVRLHAGRQASVLNMIITELPPDHPVSDTRPLRDTLGHTPLQVCASACPAKMSAPPCTDCTRVTGLCQLLAVPLRVSVPKCGKHRT